ncbi:hypothetical protein ABWU59_28985 [Priestia megaterium]|uniref:hypothetical protein n=1 Tax=Priestia megaterium TaxID=1404 RepID=UPI0033957AAC
MDRELLEVSIYKTGEDREFTKLTMTYSDFKVFHEYIQRDGIKYEPYTSKKREYYVIKEFWLALTEKENGSKKFQVDITIKEK